jgi:hypothetical protein
LKSAGISSRVISGKWSMELLIYGFPIFAGIIGSRYLSRLANFCLIGRGSARGSRNF